MPKRKEKNGIYAQVRMRRWKHASCICAVFWLIVPVLCKRAKPDLLLGGVGDVPQ